MEDNKRELQQIGYIISGISKGTEWFEWADRPINQNDWTNRLSYHFFEFPAKKRLEVRDWQSIIKCSTVMQLKWPVSANDCQYGLIWCNQGVTVPLINLIKWQRPVIDDFLMTTFNHSGPSPCFFLGCTSQAPLSVCYSVNQPHTPRNTVHLTEGCKCAICLSRKAGG